MCGERRERESDTKNIIDWGITTRTISVQSITAKRGILPPPSFIGKVRRIKWKEVADFIEFVFGRRGSRDERGSSTFRAACQLRSSVCIFVVCKVVVSLTWRTQIPLMLCRWHAANVVDDDADDSEHMYNNPTWVESRIGLRFSRIVKVINHCETFANFRLGLAKSCCFIVQYLNF